MSKLKSAPRLLATERHFDKLTASAGHPLLEAAERSVTELAEQAVGSPEIEYDRSRHNALLVRARRMQARVITLLVQWRRTGQTKYREAAVEHLREMGRWEYWSWIALRRGEQGPLAEFDLSYGENCATLALAFDWLGETMSEEQRELLIALAERWGIAPFLHRTEGEHLPFWYRRAGNNWNTVCTGGAGMLALAMYEHLDGADVVLERVESSFEPYMHHLDACGGGWEEGVGYWNYGMRYAYMYLLSWSRAHGERHPLLELEGASRTLEFPLDLTPNGVACGFGDVNRFRPLAFHYAAAEEFGREDLYPRLDALLDGRPAGGWANPAELLLFHPRTSEPLPPNEGPIIKRYPRLDWAILADAQPRPGLFLSVRGGTTEVNHSHLDLFSINCVVGDEAMLANVGVGEYLDTTFSRRRYDLWETRPDSKNTLMIEGVGIEPRSAVRMARIDSPSARGFRLEGAGAFGEMRDGPVAEACARAVLLIDESHALIVDYLRARFFGRYEARFHTPYEPAIEAEGALLRGQRQMLSMRFAASVPATAHRAVEPVTTPTGDPSHMVRWCTDDLAHDCWFATLLSRRRASTVSVTSPAEGRGRVCLDHGSASLVLEFDESLALVGETRPSGSRA